MALFYNYKKDGIQEGNNNDYCFKCCKPGQMIKDEHILERQEVFKVNVNGLDYCLCLDHLQELIKPYVLVHSDTLTDKDVVTIPRELLKTGTEKEVLEYLEKACVTNDNN